LGCVCQPLRAVGEGGNESQKRNRNKPINGVVLVCITHYMSMINVTTMFLSSICEKTTSLIFLYLQLVHHFINRKLVVRTILVYNLS
jgi:hypothetical protein